LLGSIRPKRAAPHRKESLTDHDRGAPPKTSMGEAISSVQSHRAGLTRYLDYGFLSIDNYVSERRLLDPAIGRKSWILCI
jgi:hypothetical protein